MKRKHLALFACALILCSACDTGKTQGPANAPVQAQGMSLEDAPAIWQEYFAGARAADQIQDSFKRCLAFPDLPGNHWPEGHSRAHCRSHALNLMTIEDVSGLLERGDVSGLEKRIDVYRDKHFSRKDFREDIHFFFDVFSNPESKTDALTARWLALAPKSAYAHLARANHYRGIAIAARGQETINKVKPANLRRMSESIDRAIPLLREAISLEPKLMPAYVWLFDLAMLDSRHELMAEALKGAREQDPACLALADARMRSLQPRWGGSYEEMLAYSKELAGYTKQRPHLAVHVGAPYADRGDVLVSMREFTRETDEVLKTALDTGSNETHLWLAAMAVLNRTDVEPDKWRAVAYLLQAARYEPITAWSNRVIAAHIGPRDPEWAVRYAQQAVDLEPGNAFDRVTLAGLLNRLGRHQEALTHFLVASEMDEFREVGLSASLIIMMEHPEVMTPQLKPQPDTLVERLTREYPRNPEGWLYRIRLDQRAGNAPSEEDIRQFTSLASFDNPRHRAAIEEFRKKNQDSEKNGHDAAKAPSGPNR